MASSAFVDMEEDFVGEESSSMTEGLLDGEEGPQKEGWAKYEGYFDVDTADILSNLKLCILPKPGLSPVHDLYGPFWIATSLVFSSSLAADLRYDFDAISLAAGFFFPYLCITPLALYGTLVWKQIPTQKRIPELVSIYGYALLPLIPLTFLLVLPLPYIAHNLFIIAGSLWSSATLALLLWNHVPGPFKHIFAAIHFIILFVFLYFFTRFPYPSPSADLTASYDSGPAKIHTNNTQSA